MMVRPLIVGVLVASVIATSGCGPGEGDEMPAEVRVALEGADRFELLSLDPVPSAEKSELFHEQRVLGRTWVADAGRRKALVTALKQGVAERPPIAACFFPRHGIRAEHDGKVVDLVICFECHQIEVHIDDHSQPGLPTTESPQPAFDQILRDAGVPLAARKPR